MSKGQSKLSVDALVERNNIVFSANIRHIYVELSFRYGVEHFVCKPTRDEFNAFWKVFHRLTYQKGHRTDNAVLKNFHNYGSQRPSREIRIQLTDKGMYNMSLFDSGQNEPPLVTLILRKQEAKDIFGKIYRYFLD